MFLSLGTEILDHISGAEGQAAAVAGDMNSVTFEAPGSADEIGEIMAGRGEDFDPASTQDQIINITRDTSLVSGSPLTIDQLGTEIETPLTPAEYLNHALLSNPLINPFGGLVWVVQNLFTVHSLDNINVPEGVPTFGDVAVNPVHSMESAAGMTPGTEVFISDNGDRTYINTEAGWVYHFNTNGTAEISVRDTSGNFIAFNISEEGQATPVNGELPPLDGPIEYTIQSGDSLSVIAKVYHTSVEALLEANPNITDPNSIKAGDKLVITDDLLGEDWENDGTGVWDGTVEGMDTSDLDTQFNNDLIDGLIWDDSELAADVDLRMQFMDEHGDRFALVNSPDFSADQQANLLAAQELAYQNWKVEQLNPLPTTAEQFAAAVDSFVQLQQTTDLAEQLGQAIESGDGGGGSDSGSNSLPDQAGSLRKGLLLG